MMGSTFAASEEHCILNGLDHCKMQRAASIPLKTFEF